MRKLIFVFLTLSLAAPLSRAVESKLPPGMSLETYVDRSALELRQVRMQVDLTARQPNSGGQERFAPVYDALSDAEQALADLRRAAPSEKDQRLGKFEDERNKAMRVWREFHLTQASGNARRD